MSLHAICPPKLILPNQGSTIAGRIVDRFSDGILFKNYFPEEATGLVLRAYGSSAFAGQAAWARKPGTSGCFPTGALASLYGSVFLFVPFSLEHTIEINYLTDSVSIRAVAWTDQDVVFLDDPIDISFSGDGWITRDLSSQCLGAVALIILAFRLDPVVFGGVKPFGSDSVISTQAVIGNRTDYLIPCAGHRKVDICSVSTHPTSYYVIGYVKKGVYGLPTPKDVSLTETGTYKDIDIKSSIFGASMAIVLVRANISKWTLRDKNDSTDYYGTFGCGACAIVSVLTNGVIEGEVGFVNANTGFHLIGAIIEPYRMSLSNLRIPYEDVDQSKELHLKLENLSPTSKSQGEDGEVSIEVTYGPAS